MRAIIKSNEELFEGLIAGILTNGYAIEDGFLSLPEVQAILDASARSYQAGGFNVAGIGRHQHYQLNQKIRSDHIQWLDHRNPPEACLPFFGRLQQMIQYFNQHLYLGIRDMELHFAVYPTGAFYKRHLDVFQHTKARKIWVVCYLNTHWAAEDGGQLRLYLPQDDGTENAVDVLPLAGRLVCFNSHSLEHEVLPARRQRHSITGWLKDEQSLF